MRLYREGSLVDMGQSRPSIFYVSFILSALGRYCCKSLKSRRSNSGATVPEPAVRCGAAIVQLSVELRVFFLVIEFPDRVFQSRAFATPIDPGESWVIDPPSLKWSDLKYVFWHQGGPICRGRGTSLRRLSRSCGKSMFLSHRARALPMQSARSALARLR